MISSSCNASAHSAVFIRKFLADKKISVVPYPPYSPDCIRSLLLIFTLWSYNKTFYTTVPLVISTNYIGAVTCRINVSIRVKNRIIINNYILVT